MHQFDIHCKLMSFNNDHRRLIATDSARTSSTCKSSPSRWSCRLSCVLLRCRCGGFTEVLISNARCDHSNFSVFAVTNLKDVKEV